MMSRNFGHSNNEEDDGENYGATEVLFSGHDRYSAIDHVEAGADPKDDDAHDVKPTTECPRCHHQVDAGSICGNCLYNTKFAANPSHICPECGGQMEPNESWDALVGSPMLECTNPDCRKIDLKNVVEQRQTPTLFDKQGAEDPDPGTLQCPQGHRLDTQQHSVRHWCPKCEDWYEWHQIHESEPPLFNEYNKPTWSIDRYGVVDQSIDLFGNISCPHCGSDNVREYFPGSGAKSYICDHCATVWLNSQFKTSLDQPSTIDLFGTPTCPGCGSKNVLKHEMRTGPVYQCLSCNKAFDPPATQQRQGAEEYRNPYRTLWDWEADPMCPQGHELKGTSLDGLRAWCPTCEQFYDKGQATSSPSLFQAAQDPYAQYPPAPKCAFCGAQMEFRGGFMMYLQCPECHHTNVPDSLESPQLFNPASLDYPDRWEEHNSAMPEGWMDQNAYDEADAAGYKCPRGHAVSNREFDDLKAHHRPTIWCPECNDLIAMEDIEQTPQLWHEGAWQMPGSPDQHSAPQLWQAACPSCGSDKVSASLNYINPFKDEEGPAFICHSCLSVWNSRGMIQIGYGHDQRMMERGSASDPRFEPIREPMTDLDGNSVIRRRQPDFFCPQGHPMNTGSLFNVGTPDERWLCPQCDKSYRPHEVQEENTPRLFTAAQTPEQRDVANTMMCPRGHSIEFLDHGPDHDRDLAHLDDVWCPSCGLMWAPNQLVKSAPTLFDHRGAKTAGMTVPQYKQQMAELDRKLGPDESEIVHPFGDGWSIARHHRPNDVGRVGVLMNNCWANHNGRAPYVNSSYYSLRDRNSIPRVAFMVQPLHMVADEPIAPELVDRQVAHTALGHGNAQPKPQYLNRVSQWAEQQGYLPDPSWKLWKKPVPYKTAMAERTGDPAIDELIDEWTMQGEVELPGGEPLSLEQLRQPENAEGLCSDVAECFAEFAQSRGLDAQTTSHDTQWQYADQMGFDVPKGYGHDATIIKHNGVTWLVDWTSAQFGHEGELPMVQRLGEKGWQWKPDYYHSKTAEIEDPEPPSKLHVFGPPNAQYDEKGIAPRDVPEYLNQLGNGVYGYGEDMRWQHSPSDGELYEVDMNGLQDEMIPDYELENAWYHPGPIEPQRVRRIAKTGEWDQIPFAERMGEKPRERDVPPQTSNGRLVFYHGTSPEAAERIAQEQMLRPDDLNVVGLATTPGQAQTFGVMKKGPVLRVEIDPQDLAPFTVTHEVGGSGHSQFLVHGEPLREWQGVPLQSVAVEPEYSGSYSDPQHNSSRHDGVVDFPIKPPSPPASPHAHVAYRNGVGTVTVGPDCTEVRLSNEFVNEMYGYACPVGHTIAPPDSATAQRHPFCWKCMKSYPLDQITQAPQLALDVAERAMDKESAMDQAIDLWGVSTCPKCGGSDITTWQTVSTRGIYEMCNACRHVWMNGKVSAHDSKHTVWDEDGTVQKGEDLIGVTMELRDRGTQGNGTPPHRETSTSIRILDGTILPTVAGQNGTIQNNDKAMPHLWEYQEDQGQSVSSVPNTDKSQIPETSSRTEANPQRQRQTQRADTRATKPRHHPQEQTVSRLWEEASTQTNALGPLARDDQAGQYHRFDLGRENQGDRISRDRQMRIGLRPMSWQEGDQTRATDRDSFQEVGPALDRTAASEPWIAPDGTYGWHLGHPEDHESIMQNGLYANDPGQMEQPAGVYMYDSENPYGEEKGFDWRKHYDLYQVDVSGLPLQNDEYANNAFVHQEDIEPGRVNLWRAADPEDDTPLPWDRLGASEPQAVYTDPKGHVVLDNGSGYATCSVCGRVWPLEECIEGSVLSLPGMKNNFKSGSHSDGTVWRASSEDSPYRDSHRTGGWGEQDEISSDDVDEMSGRNRGQGAPHPRYLYHATDAVPDDIEEYGLVGNRWEHPDAELPKGYGWDEYGNQQWSDNGVYAVDNYRDLGPWATSEGNIFKIDTLGLEHPIEPDPNAKGAWRIRGNIHPSRLENLGGADSLDWRPDAPMELLPHRERATGQGPKDRRWRLMYGDDFRTGSFHTAGDVAPGSYVCPKGHVARPDQTESFNSEYPAPMIACRECGSFSHPYYYYHPDYDLASPTPGMEERWTRDAPSLFDVGRTSRQDQALDLFGGMTCPFCGSGDVTDSGTGYPDWSQYYFECNGCHRSFSRPATQKEKRDQAGLNALEWREGKVGSWWDQQEMLKGPARERVNLPLYDGYGKVLGPCGHRVIFDVDNYDDRPWSCEQCGKTYTPEEASMGERLFDPQGKPRYWRESAQEPPEGETLSLLGKVCPSCGNPATPKDPQNMNPDWEWWKCPQCEYSWPELRPGKNEQEIWEAYRDEIGADPETPWERVRDWSEEQEPQQPPERPHWTAMYTSKEAMAEQSGHPLLDELIEKFKALPSIRSLGVPDNYSWYDADKGVEQFRDEMAAYGSCDVMAKAFATYLTGLGVPARATSEQPSANFYPEAEGSGTYSPYSPEHVVTEVTLDGETYMVDWTASQFDLSEFPMVQKMGPNKLDWQRQWTSMAADPEWWANLQKTNPYVYHSGPEESLEGIRQHGIVPWDDPRHPGSEVAGTLGEPRPGHTYFNVDRSPGYGKIQYRIPAHAFDPAHINPDEDDFEKAGTPGGFLSEEHGLGDDPADTHEGIENRSGNFAYRGSIPPHQIEYRIPEDDMDPFMRNMFGEAYVGDEEEGWQPLVQQRRSMDEWTERQFDEKNPDWSLVPPCPKCGGQMDFRDNASLGPMYPEGAWQCYDCFNVFPLGGITPDAPEAPAKPEDHPDPWMDNEPGTLELPPGWTAKTALWEPSRGLKEASGGQPREGSPKRLRKEQEAPGGAYGSRSPDERPPAPQSNPWRHSIMDEMKIKRTSSRGLQVFTAVAGKHAIGYVQVRESAAEAEVFYIWVDPRHRGKGIGKKLIAAAEEANPEKKLVSRIETLEGQRLLDSMPGQFEQAGKQVRKVAEVAPTWSADPQHELNWQPGSEGKGFVLNNGAVWTWPTLHMRPMHMQKSKVVKSRGLGVEPQSAFHIQPDGEVYTYGPDRIISEPNKQTIAEADPNLNVPGAMANIPQNDYGHAQNLLDTLQRQVARVLAKIRS